MCLFFYLHFEPETYFVVTYHFYNILTILLPSLLLQLTLYFCCLLFKLFVLYCFLRE